MIDNIKPPVRPSSVDSADSQPDYVPPQTSDPTPKSTTTTFSASKNHFKLRLPTTKKGWIIFAACCVAVIGLLVGVYFKFFKSKPAPKPAPVAAKKEEPPKPTIVASKLTGVPVAPEVNDLPLTGVMIENSPDARPQAGLTNAGVVFEAIAEGGITRFLAIFQSNDANPVGPIRSARPYYLNWLFPFEASYAHVGGSPDAKADISALGIRDLDQFVNSASYQRVNTRYAPHNVYSSTDRLVALGRSKGYNSSNAVSWPRKDDKPINPPTVKTIDLTISGYLYNTHYDYDAASNSYKRSLASKPHTDEKTGAQISPKVLIAMVMPQGLAADRLHTTYGDVGSGKVYVFQDGGYQEGTWAKADRKSQVSFKDAAGNPIKLNPGQTWVTVVGQQSAVLYKP